MSYLKRRVIGSCICFATGCHVSRSKSFFSWESDIHDGFAYRLFIRWCCIWQVGIPPFLSEAVATEAELITEIVFSPSHQGMERNYYSFAAQRSMQSPLW